MATPNPKPKLATLSLPRELRDHIYEYLLTETFLVENIWSGDSASSVPLKMHTHPAILNVSKSTHQEAKQVLYRHGTFRFDSFETEPRPLYEAIKNLPDIDLLQSIIYHFNTALHVWYTDDPVWGHRGYTHPVEFAVLPVGLYYNYAASPVGTATKLINHFAKLDYSSPRSRFVVDIVAGDGSEFFLGAGRDSGVFQDALSRLTGFKKVEVKLECTQTEHWNFIFPLVQALDEKLAITLGDSERDSEEGPKGGRSCLVYHPRNK